VGDNLVESNLRQKLTEEGSAEEDYNEECSLTP
jgi:hypothetical protein